MSIPELIKRLANVKQIYPLVCEVVEVYPESGTVDVMPLDEPEFFDVRVNAEISPAKGVVILPKKGSKVFVMPTGGSSAIVVMASEVTKYTLKVGELTFEVDETGLLLQKGDDTLKDALTLIIQAIQAIVVIQGTNPDYVKLSQALAKVNNLLK